MARKTRLAVVFLCIMAPGFVAGATTVTTVGVPEPSAVAVNPLTNTIYVSGNACETWWTPGEWGRSCEARVSVIDGTTDSLVATIPLSHWEWTCTNQGCVGPIYSNVAGRLAVDALANRVYVPLFGSLEERRSETVVIDGNTDTVVARLPLSGIGARATTANPFAALVFTVTVWDRKVHVIDGATNSVTASMHMAEIGRDTVLSFDPVADILYCDDPSGVHVVDGTTAAPLATIDSTDYPGLAVNPVSHRLYLKDHEQVSVIDSTIHEVVDALGIVDPNGLAADPLANRVYVTHTSTLALSVVDGATNEIVGEVSLSRGEGAGRACGSEAIAVNPLTRRLYILDACRHAVIVVDDSDPAEDPDRLLVGRINGLLVDAGSDDEDGHLLNAVVQVQEGAYAKAVASLQAFAEEIEGDPRLPGDRVEKLVRGAHKIIVMMIGN